MASVELTDIRKRFGAIETIHGVSLAIASGEFVVFVGPSGCGKSTLLRMIAGLESVSAGAIRIGGREVTDAQPSARKVAMVFQSYALYPHMSVRDNLSFGMRMRGVDSDVIAAKLKLATEMLRLTPYLERKPGELSGGQAQRVAIGRALVQEPDVFLFDEPLSNLDAELRLKTRIELAALHKQLRRTMIYVTHDQVEAMTLADKIVVLRDGRIEQVGAPMDLYDRPQNQFVASFIGSPAMNFLPAQLVPSPTGVGQLHCCGASFGVRVADLAPQDITLGVRPEHISVAEASSADNDLGLLGEVISVERLGVTAYVYTRLTAASAGGEAPVCVEVRGDCAWRAGDRVRLRFSASKLHCFSAQGERIECVAISPAH